MQHILVIWEYDNPHDNVLSRIRHLLGDSVEHVTLIGYTSGGASKTEAEVRAAAAEILPQPLQVDNVVLSSADTLEQDIMATSEAQAFDLLAKSAAPKTSLFTTSIDAKLLRQLKLPKLICANHRRKSGNAMLATVDLSDDALQSAINDQVLTAAGELSKSLHKELNIAYVIPINRTDYELELSDPMMLMRKHGPAATEKLKQLAARHNLQSAKLHISAGLPEIEIGTLAKASKSDLVVVGSVGRKGLKGLLLGNTAERMIENLKRDVYVVRPTTRD